MRNRKVSNSMTERPEGAAARVSRRSFLNILWTALGLAALVEFLWLAFSFLWTAKSGKLQSQEITVVPAGALSSFEAGTVTAFQKGEFYLVRLADGGVLALSCRCTHLGCSVPWVEKEKKFLCPCHSSAFDTTGNVIRSPAARALDTFAVTIENNIVKVDTSRRIKRSGFEAKQVVYPKIE